VHIGGLNGIDVAEQGKGNPSSENNRQEKKQSGGTTFQKSCKPTGNQVKERGEGVRVRAAEKEKGN